MKQYIKIVKGLLLGSLLGLTVLLGSQSLAVASPVGDACKGLKLAEPGATCGKAAAEKSTGNIVRAVINTLSIIVGSVAVIMVIIGGFRYIISAGDSNSVQGAKNTILYAIVGLAVVVFAQVIVRFVLTKIS